jgi:DHA2 family multidrug resistance protein
MPVVIAATVGTMPVTFDALMVNQSLMYIQGGLGAGSSDVAWTMTAIYTTEAIGLPMCAWFNKSFGRKATVIGATIAYMICYALCALTPSFGLLLVLRFIQGFCFGLVLPTTMSLCQAAVPAEKVGGAMGLYTIGLASGAALGPIIAGYILSGLFGMTDMWRYVFWFLLVLSVPGLIMMQLLIKEPKPTGEKPKLDLIGIVWLTLGFASLQIFVAQGVQWDWMNTWWIRALLCVSVFGLGGLAWWCLKCTSTPILDLRCLKDMNLVVSCAGIFTCLIAQYGAIIAYPQLMAMVYGYDPIWSGIVNTASIGAALIMIPISAKLGPVVGLKQLALAGVGVMAYGYYMMLSFYADTDAWNLILANFVFQAGAMVVQYCFITMALAWQPKALVNDGSSFYNVIKFTGAGIGIGLASAVTAVRTQFWTQRTGELLTAYTPEVNSALTTLPKLVGGGMDQTGYAATTAAAVLSGQQMSQVTMLTFIDQFYLFMLITLAMVLCVLPMKRMPTSEEKQEIDAKYERGEW